MPGRGAHNLYGYGSLKMPLRRECQLHHQPRQRVRKCPDGELVHRRKLCGAPATAGRPP